MKNILIITQKVDDNDDLLGFFVSWIKEFSKNFDKVFVITLGKGEYNLPSNVFVYSLGKERRSSKVSRFFTFYRLLFKLVPKSKGVFAHMSPIFAITSWPIAVLFGRKIFLWYLHRSSTFRLKLAEKLCSEILTADKDSLTIKSSKIIELGHGIDIEKFRIQRNWSNLNSRQINILSIGRISKIKDYETLIKAAKILKDRGLAFKASIVGRPVMSYDFEYFKELRKMVDTLGLKNHIEFIGFVPYSRIADYYKKSDIFVNLAPRGGIDKVVLEAMASGSLVLVSNSAFKKYLGSYDLLFKHGEAVDLAEKVIKLGDLSIRGIENISGFFVQSVRKHHDLKNTISAMSRLFYR